MTSLPVWAVYCVSFGAPLAAFAGVLVGQLVTRRGAFELDRRAKREESMRTLRWAGELAVSDDIATARLGVAALDALNVSPWLQAEDQAFIEAVLEAVVEPDKEAYDESGYDDVLQLNDARGSRFAAADGAATTQEESP